MRVIFLLFHRSSLQINYACQISDTVNSVLFLFTTNKSRTFAELYYRPSRCLCTFRTIMYRMVALQPMVFLLICTSHQFRGTQHAHIFFLPVMQRKCNYIWNTKILTYMVMCLNSGSLIH